MALVLQSNPGTYYSVHDDLVFVVYEATKANDPVTYPDYKYVCDIYVAGKMIRLKAFPDPSSKKGVFNISRAVRNYIDNPELNPIAGVIAANFESGQFFLDVQCKFGEEYNYDTYTNLLTDSSRVYYNTYNNRRGQQLLPDHVGGVCSNRPLRGSIMRDASFLFVPYLPDSGTIELTVEGYDAAGLPMGDVGDSFSVDAGFLQILNLAPATLNAALPGAVPAGAVYYWVAIDGVHRFTISVACEPRHTVYPVHFLNQFGGYDTFEFRKTSRKTYDIERKNFEQLPYRIGSSGELLYENAGGVRYEGKTTYAVQASEKLTLTSDFLTDAEFTWLRDLFFSPIVYVEIDGTLYPAQLSGSNYEEKKHLNDKLQPLTVEFTLGNLNAQYR